MTVRNMHSLGIFTIRGDTIHGHENAPHWLSRTVTAVVVIPPGSHIEVVIHLLMHGVKNIKDVWIAYVGVLGNGSSIEVPGVGYRKSIHNHLHRIHIVIIQIAAISCVVVVDVTAVIGVKHCVVLII